MGKYSEEFTLAGKRKVINKGKEDLPFLLPLAVSRGWRLLLFRADITIKSIQGLHLSLQFHPTFIHRN